MSRLDCITNEFLELDSTENQSKEIIQKFLNRLKTFEEKEKFLKMTNTKK